MSPDRLGIIITCEHGGNQVPALYRHLFVNERQRLDSHRGYDLGALSMARELANALKAPFYFSKTTRLLIELNRSLGHGQLFSEITRHLDAAARQKIIDKYYHSYRTKATQAILQIIQRQKKVVHLSIHSFTPVLNDQPRLTDIGILYDPKRSFEKEISNILIQAAKTVPPYGLKYRRNYPYKGTSDGFTTSLRKQFEDGQYAGLEIEVNQQFYLNGRKQFKTICNHLVHVIKRTTSMLLK